MLKINLEPVASVVMTGAALKRVTKNEYMGKRLFFVGFSMAFRILYIICLLMLSSELLAQRQMVVVNIESKVPVRDVIVSADDGRGVRSSWNGLFEVPDSFERIDFRHPDFEHRYVLKSELLGDTIFLIPNTNALSEVVIYGERRFDKRITQMLRSSPEKSLDAQLANIKIPADFNPIGFALWIYDITMRQKVEDRQRRKRGLKEVRRQEAEYVQMWNSLEKKHEGAANRK